MKKHLMILVFIFAIFYIFFMVYNIHFSSIKAVESVLKVKNIIADDYEVIQYKNYKYHVAHNDRKLLLVRVKRIAGLFWTVDYTDIYDMRNELVDYNVLASDSITIVYGISNDKAITSIGLTLGEDKDIKKHLEDSRMFVFSYINKEQFWNELYALNKFNEKIWFVKN